jgi:hypothetical protein
MTGKQGRDKVSTSLAAALVTPSLLNGTWAVRVSIGAERTERADVEELWRLLQQASPGVPYCRAAKRGGC